MMHRETFRERELRESEKDFRSWLPFLVGVWAGVIILLVKGF